jgi:putative glutamine amidotransferase
VAPGLDAVAVAPDGTIEAVEMAGHPFFLAVQWHPEMTASVDAAQQRLFNALVAEARKNSERRRTAVTASAGERPLH